MAFDPLSLLRQYIVSGKDIIEKGEKIGFGEYSWLKKTETNYMMARYSWKDGREKEYYTLEALLFLVKNKDLSHPVYVRRAAAANILVVTRRDREDLLAYLLGEKDTSDSIVKRGVVVLPMRKRTVEPVMTSPRVKNSKKPTLIAESGKKQNIGTPTAVQSGSKDIICITLDEDGKELTNVIEKTKDAESAICITIDGGKEQSNDNTCSSTAGDHVPTDDPEIPEDTDDSSSKTTCALNDKDKEQVSKLKVDSDNEKADELATICKHLDLKEVEQDKTNLSISDDHENTVTSTSEFQEDTVEPPKNIPDTTSRKEQIELDTEITRDNVDLALEQRLENKPVAKKRKSSRLVKDGQPRKRKYYAERLASNSKGNGKKYPCATCGKELISKTTLAAHQLVHSDLRPFSCSPCKSNFKTYSGWNRHLNSKLHNANFRLEKLGSTSSQQISDPVQDTV